MEYFDKYFLFVIVIIIIFKNFKIEKFCVQCSRNNVKKTKIKLSFVLFVGILVFTLTQITKSYKVDDPCSLGVHDIAELSGCNNEILSNLSKLEEILIEAAKKAGACRIGHITRQTAKDINSCIVLVEESHLSIHAFPLLGYAAVDMFTCGGCDNEKAIAYIERELQVQSSIHKKIIRGISKQRVSGAQTMLCKDEQKGGQLIVDICGCKEDIINNEKKIEVILREAIEKAGVQVINSVPYKFHPQGVSCIVLAQNGSQITIHTWPELDENYCAIDILTCGDTGPDETLKFLKKKLEASNLYVMKVTRGFASFDILNQIT